jgi:Flp pilus assembly pilin Flp
MSKFMKRIIGDESGASATEYAMVLAMVGAAVFALGATFTTKLGDLFTALYDKMALWIT